jgi:hypothetical protein
MAYERIPIPRKNGRIDIDAPLPRRNTRNAPAKAGSPLLKYALALSTIVGAASYFPPALLQHTTLPKAERVQSVSETLAASYAVPQGRFLGVGSYRNAAHALGVAREFEQQGFEVAYQQTSHMGFNRHHIWVKPHGELYPLVQHLKAHERVKPAYYDFNGKPRKLDLDSIIFDERVAPFRNLPYFQQMKAGAQEARKRFDIGDPREFMAFHYAIVETESHFNPNAKSRKDAHGLGQLIPSTGRIVDKLLGKKPNASDWHYRRAMKNEHNGALYSGMLLAEHLDNWKSHQGQRRRDLAAAEYNSGYKNVMTHFLHTAWQNQIPETRDYVAKVREKFHHYMSNPATTYARAKQLETQARLATVQPGA